MANYQEDYSGLSAAGGFLKGFTDSLQTGEDRKMKKMELDAHLKAQEDQKQRNVMLDSLALQKAGYQKGDDGSLQEAPLTDRQQDEQTLSGMEKGVSTKWDPDSGRPSYSYDPNSPQSIGAHAKIFTAEHRNDEKPIKPQEWAKFSDALNPNKARGGNLAKTQGMINSADRINALFQQFPDGNIPKTQSVELGTAVAGLISGGSPQSQQQIHDIVPSSVLGSVADLGSWYTNNPTGREQQQFMQLLQDTTGRERDIAVKQKLEAQRAVLPAWEHLRSADPERYQRQLKAMGVTEFDDPQAAPPQTQAAPKGMLKENPGLLSQLGGLLFGNKAAAAPPTAPQDPDALKYAQMHNMDYPTALAIISKRKAGQ